MFDDHDCLEAYSVNAAPRVDDGRDLAVHQRLEQRDRATNTVACEQLGNKVEAAFDAVDRSQLRVLQHNQRESGLSAEIAEVTRSTQLGHRKALD